MYHVITRDNFIKKKNKNNEEKYIKLSSKINKKKKIKMKKYMILNDCKY